MYEYYARWHLGPPWSHIAFWLPLVVSLIATLFALAHMMAARKRALAALNSFSRELADVGDRYARGIVKFARDAKLAVRVEIVQAGQYKKPGRRSVTELTKWREVSREVIAEPFYLVHSDGSRIRVEPGTKVLLADRIDTIKRNQDGSRTQLAELAEGDEVVVEGLVSVDFDPEGQAREALRGAPEGLVLRPSDREPLVISTRPMHEEHEHRALAWKRSFGLAAATLGVFVFLNLGYLARFGGEPATATVVHKRVEPGKNTKYHVRYRDERGEFYAETMSSSEHFRVKKGHKVAIRRAGRWTTLGSGLSIDFRGVLGGLAAAGGALFLALHLLRRPWYRRRVVNERERVPLS